MAVWRRHVLKPVRGLCPPPGALLMTRPPCACILFCRMDQCGCVGGATTSQQTASACPSLKQFSPDPGCWVMPACLCVCVRGLFASGSRGHVVWRQRGYVMVGSMVTCPVQDPTEAWTHGITWLGRPCKQRFFTAWFTVVQPVRSPPVPIHVLPTQPAATHLKDVACLRVPF